MDRHRLDMIKSKLLGKIKLDAHAIAMELDLSINILDNNSGMYFHILIKDNLGDIRLLKINVSEVKDIAGTVSHSDLVDLQSNHLGIMPEHDQMQVAQQGRFDTVQFRNQAIELKIYAASVGQSPLV